MASERAFALVLAGTDGSPRAEVAVRQAARMAAADGAALRVAFVIDTGRPHDRDVEREAEAALERASSIAAAEGVQAEGRILAGEPWEALGAEATRERADLLALGPDAGLLGGAIRIGQTTAHLLRQASCSVLVARPAGEGFPGRIVCGVDGSDASVATADLAAAIAVVARAELRLVHVIPVFRGDDAWTLEADEASPPELEPAVRVAAARGVTPVREMASGRPEHALVDAANRGGSDLLVVGYRGVRGVRRVLLGSVSEHAVHHARCSVLVARPARG